MKSICRNVVSPPLAHDKPPAESSFYMFHEKNTGTAHFHVEAGPDGELPVDHAAGLLAMQCMVRGRCPSDYLIMVPAAPENLCDIGEKAQKLLEAGLSSMFLRCSPNSRCVAPATMIRGFAPESEVSRRAANSGEIFCLERPRMMA